MKEAIASSESEKWKEAMEKEMRSIEAYEVWELVELPKGKKTIGCNGSTNTSLVLMDQWRGTRLALSPKVSLSSMDWIMMKPSVH